MFTFFYLMAFLISRNSRFTKTCVFIILLKVIFAIVIPYLPNIDINFNGICSYCKKSIDLTNEDYILISLESN